MATRVHSASIVTYEVVEDGHVATTCIWVGGDGVHVVNMEVSGSIAKEADSRGEKRR